MEAVKKEFKNTSAIEECVNNLIDAYLICIGTVEGILDNKKYVKFPEETSALKEAVEEIKPEMEAIDVIKNQVDLQVEDDEVALISKDIEDVDADKLVLEVSDEEREILESEFEDNEDFEYIADDEVEKDNKSRDKEEKEFEPFGKGESFSRLMKNFVQYCFLTKGRPHKVRPCTLTSESIQSCVPYLRNRKERYL